MKREPITNAESLAAWRALHGLSQVKAAVVFRRSRRMYQYLEAGEFPKKDAFPPELDDFARLYELTHRNKKNGVKKCLKK